MYIHMTFNSIISHVYIIIVIIDLIKLLDDHEIIVLMYVIHRVTCLERGLETHLKTSNVCLLTLFLKYE